MPTTRTNERGCVLQVAAQRDEKEAEFLGALTAHHHLATTAPTPPLGLGSQTAKPPTMITPRMATAMAMKALSSRQSSRAMAGSFLTMIPTALTRKTTTAATAACLRRMPGVLTMGAIPTAMTEITS